MEGEREKAPMFRIPRRATDSALLKRDGTISRKARTNRRILELLCVFSMTSADVLSLSYLSHRKSSECKHTVGWIHELHAAQLVCNEICQQNR